MARAEDRNPRRAGRRRRAGLSHRQGPARTGGPASSSTASSAAGWRPGRWSRARTSSSATTAPATSKCCGSSAPRRKCRSRWPSRWRSAARSSPVRGFARWCRRAGWTRPGRCSAGRIGFAAWWSAGRAAAPQLGYPTANLGQIDTLLPGEGIYAARALAEGVWYPAAVSLGPNPTFDEGGLKVEAYLIGFQGTLYGQPIEVDFLARLRDIKRFASVDALVAQMARDVARTVEIVGTTDQHRSDDLPPMIPWPRFVEIVRGHQRFVLTTHIRPDGDALGSELAMAAILEALGKDVRVCNAFAVPPNLRFLDPRRKLQQLGVDVSAEQLDDREVLIVLDTTAWAQLGAMADVIKNTKAVKVVLDHHVSGDDLGAELFKDAEAEATGRLVVEAADQLGVPLSAGDRPAGVRRPGHRHRLVPLQLDHGRHVAAGRAAGRGGRGARPALQGALRERHATPGCN